MSAPVVAGGEPATSPVISHINIYPIKSCGAISLDSAELGQFGFEYDRRWMIVVEEGEGDFKCLTQRECPKLALITPKFASNGFEIRAPGMAPLALPFEGLADEWLIDAKLFGVPFEGFDEGDEVSGWLCTFLGRNKYSVRLLRVPDDFDRQIPEDLQVEGANPALAWFDDAPILLIAEESLNQLNTWLTEGNEQTVPMSRFRPNIVVRGVPAFDEDSWATANISHSADKISLHSVKKCTRCKLTGVNQATGNVDSPSPIQPLTTIQKKHGATFGSYFMYGGAEPGQRISIGDSISVDKRK